MKKTNYSEYAEKRAEKSPTIKNALKAFSVGGLICVIGQALTDIYKAINISETNIKTLVPSTLIFFAALLTGIGAFDKIAKFAGAGTLVPITGFANAVAAPAVDCKSEGLVLGLGSNMFKIAGSVILYGTVASVLYGAVYWVIKMV